MKIFLALIIIFLLSNCSFDNKSGIWTNNNSNVKKEDQFKDFETLYSQTQTFNTIVRPDKSLMIILDPIKKNYKWTDEFYNDSNNLENFAYKELNEIIFKSQKISRSEVKKTFLFENQNAIFVDYKGNIIVYSLEKENIIFKYNFYKKNYKKIKKILNFIVEDNIIYVGDNFGYLYAVDYLNNKLIWAKNFKIPFRSNLKILENKLIIADTNNSLIYINKTNGNKLKAIPTEETLIMNNFVNSLATIKENLYYLNTYGSLYSLNNNGRIKWFINLNQSIDINPTNLFNSNPIVINKDKLIISTNLFLYFIDLNSGSTLFKISISSLLKPIVSGDNLFLITKDNLLVSININSFKINYSVDLEQTIANFLDVKKKKPISIKTLLLVNNNLFLFLNNSFFIKLDLFGEIKEISKLSSKIKSDPIFINESLIYINNKNKLIISN
jgi:outer membrane protein assembly factor BamB